MASWSEALAGRMVIADTRNCKATAPVANSSEWQLQRLPYNSLRWMESSNTWRTPRC